MFCLFSALCEGKSLTLSLPEGSPLTSKIVWRQSLSGTYRNVKWYMKCLQEWKGLSLPFRNGSCRCCHKSIHEGPFHSHLMTTPLPHPLTLTKVSVIKRMLRDTPDFGLYVPVSSCVWNLADYRWSLSFPVILDFLCKRLNISCFCVDRSQWVFLHNWRHHRWRLCILTLSIIPCRSILNWELSTERFWTTSGNRKFRNKKWRRTPQVTDVKTEVLPSLLKREKINRLYEH